MGGIGFHVWVMTLDYSSNCVLRVGLRTVMTILPGYLEMGKA